MNGFWLNFVEGLFFVHVPRSNWLHFGGDPTALSRLCSPGGITMLGGGFCCPSTDFLLDLLDQLKKNHICVRVFSDVCEGRGPSVAPMKMAVGGVPAQLQFGGDSALQSAYGVLPDINHRQAGQSASQPSNFALSVISAPAPLANRQTEHPPTCHNHHFRPTADDSSIRGQRAPQLQGR